MARKARPKTRATGRANPVLGKESKGGWVGLRRRPQPPQPRHLEQCGHATRTPFCFEAPYETRVLRPTHLRIEHKVGKTDAKINVIISEMTQLMRHFKIPNHGLWASHCGPPTRVTRETQARHWLSPGLPPGPECSWKESRSLAAARRRGVLHIDPVATALPSADAALIKATLHRRLGPLRLAFPPAKETTIDSLLSAYS